VDLRLRLPEQRVEEKRAQEAGRARQEDASGLAQGNSISLRGYLRVESRLGPQVRPRRAPAVTVALEGFDPVAQPPDRGVFEEGAHGDVHAESVLDAARELRRGEGVAAEVEEVVVRAHLAPLEAENVLPGSREQVLLLGARRAGRDPAGRLGGVGSPGDDARRELGQAPAIHLAGGGMDREAFDLYEGRGDRVVREALLQPASYLRAASRPRVEVPAGVAPPALVLRGGDQVGD
jgi:hypothetical protein